MPVGTPPLYAVQEFIAALAAANDGNSLPQNLRVTQEKLKV